MRPFRRAIRLFLTIAGLLAGVITGIALVMARRLARPGRQPLWATPADVGLHYEPAQFPAADGVRLSGWFVPAEKTAARGGATILLLHPFPGNRLGFLVDDVLDQAVGMEPLDLLRLAHALQRVGFNVLMFDFRNHGESAQAEPATLGLAEANDVLGAVAYLRARPDVDETRLGVLGFSMGANAALFSLPRTTALRSAILVQPTSMATFNRGFAEYLVGPLHQPVLWLAQQFYHFFGGPSFGAVEPIFAAAGAGDTPLLFIQGDGDPWGSVANVAQMAHTAPNGGDPLIVPAHSRYDGYRYVIDNPAVAIDFFGKTLT